MKVEILRPDGVLYRSDDVVSITLPGEKGLFTVLPRHASLISSLVEGDIKIQEGGQSAGQEKKEQLISIKGGFVEVKKDVISVCVK